MRNNKEETNKEKLVELVKNGLVAYSNFVDETSFVPDIAEFIANYLDSNDVVISVRCGRCEDYDENKGICKNYKGLYGKHGPDAYCPYGKEK